MTGFVTSTAKKLRLYPRVCPYLPYASGVQHSASRVISPLSSHNTQELLKTALAGLVDLYRYKPEYAKTSIVLSQFEQREGMPHDLYAPPLRKNSEAFMAVVDAIKAKQGHSTVRLELDTMSMRREHLSLAYTTFWHSLPVARC